MKEPRSAPYLMYGKKNLVKTAISLAVCVCFHPVMAQAPRPGPATEQSLAPQDLDNLVAPAALYADPLLGEAFAAATYPIEIAVTPGYQTPRLTAVVPPSSPWNAVFGSAVLATAQLDEKGTVTQVRFLQGVTPFTDEAKRSISQWKFAPAQQDGNPVANEITVFMMFRPHSLGNTGLGGPSFGFVRPSIPKGDHPSLPIAVFDPELSATSLLNPPGTVIFDLEISEEGSIHQMRLINDVPAATERARQAVQQWSFTPAVKNGKRVQSTLIVAISFVNPN